MVVENKAKNNNKKYDVLKYAIIKEEISQEKKIVHVLCPALHRVGTRGGGGGGGWGRGTKYAH